MSADNWGVCPKCLKRHENRREELASRVETEYGVLDREDYKALEAELHDSPVNYEKYELREDYEFYIDDSGNFSADYSAHCYNEHCDFSFKFNHSEEVDLA